MNGKLFIFSCEALRIRLKMSFWAVSYYRRHPEYGCHPRSQESAFFSLSAASNASAKAAGKRKHIRIFQSKFDCLAAHREASDPTAASLAYRPISVIDVRNEFFNDITFKFVVVFCRVVGAPMVRPFRCYGDRVGARKVFDEPALPVQLSRCREPILKQI